MDPVIKGFLIVSIAIVVVIGGLLWIGSIIEVFENIF